MPGIVLKQFPPAGSPVRSQDPMEIKVYEGENTGHCIRCLDCTACETITLTTVLPSPSTAASRAPETA